MKGLGSFALPIVGLAVLITLVQTGQKPKDVDEVYARLKEDLDLVEVRLKVRLEDTERSLNNEKSIRRSLEVKVTWLEREINRYKGSEIPVVQGVCGVSCQIQLDNLRSGMIAEKHRASQADKAVRSIKSRLKNTSTRLEAVELDSHRLMDRENKTIKMVDIIRRRSDDLSTKLGAISLNAEGVITNSHQTNQTVQELKAVIENLSARIDVTDRKCDSLMKRTNHTDQTGTWNTTALVQTRNTPALVQTRNTTAREDHSEEGTMADYLRRATDVEGAPTSRPYSESTATCPGNTTVVGCRCSHEDRTCEGVEVYGQWCWAFKSRHGSNPIQARAKCVHGGSFVVIRNPDGYSSQPLARCPSHTRVATCWLYNAVMHLQYVETRLDRGDNSCTVSEPCVDVGCKIQALCLGN